MRTQDTIDRDIADRVVLLGELIKISINEEQKNEERRNKVENEIKNLEKEASLDNTLSGLAYNLTQEAVKKVDVLLDELEQKTGVSLVAVFKLRSELKTIETPNVNLFRADLMKPSKRLYQEDNEPSL